MIPSSAEQIRFLQDLQRVLEEGVFTATYKYALLLALADIAVEKGDDIATPLFVKTEELAGRFIKYYWRQARPYLPKGSAQGEVIIQNTGRQASIITFVGRHQHSTVTQFQRDQAAWRGLVREVRRTIIDQPLWKLQVVGGKPIPFLYDHSRSNSGITLHGESVYCLRHFHALVHSLVTAAWVRFVRQLPANRGLLGHTTDLDEFLFGTERANLDRFRPILTDAQGGACFYCRRRLTGPGDIDHFVPWARYPVDLGHNFVLTHSSCNNQKRERLAALPHLERWVQRNEDCGVDLEQQFDSVAVVHDRASSVQIARWAYGQAATAGSLVWSRGDELVTLECGWETVLTT